MTLTLRNRAGLKPGPLSALAGRLGHPSTLEQILDWAAARRPPLELVEVVTQDEFTHDALMPIEPPLWLAFDVT